MDTRSKIISLEEARKRRGAKPTIWLAGHFDPMLAEHVRRLREHAAPGGLVIVEVTNPARPLMPQLARAELVAALSLVDYVVLGNGSSDSAGIDGSITERFVENVLRRHAGERSG